VQFRPFTNHLLLRLEPEPQLSRVIAVQRDVPDMARFGEVLAIGPEVRDVKIGDKVLASITAGTELPMGMLVSETAVLSRVG
jgi:co-chaperonin GroES (HSP10)